MRWLALAALVAGCAASREPPLRSIDRFDADVVAAHGKRRVVALVSPS